MVCAAEAGVINRYAPGTKLSLHQDRDGIDTPRENAHPLSGMLRYDLTFRKAA